jgi:hypothetical protein
MKDLISEIVRALVDQPDQVKVTEIEGGQTVVLELSVAKSDMGKVIGKKGKGHWQKGPECYGIKDYLECRCRQDSQKICSRDY